MCTRLVRCIKEGVEEGSVIYTYMYKYTHVYMICGRRFEIRVTLCIHVRQCLSNVIDIPVDFYSLPPECPF